jgi:hypothetical protein
MQISDRTPSKPPIGRGSAGEEKSGGRAMSVAHLHGAGRMTERKYDRERAELTATYGQSNIEAAAKRDQALAKLFYRSGWTLEELEKKEGLGKSRMEQCVRFGRFLDFSTMVEFPKNFTERRFRAYWQKTDPKATNERIRFKAVLKQIEDAPT